VPVALGLGLGEAVALGEGVPLDVPLSVPVGLLVEVPVGDGEVVPVTVGLRLRLAVLLGDGVGVWLTAKHRHTIQWDCLKDNLSTNLICIHGHSDSQTINPVTTLYHQRVWRERCTTQRVKEEKKACTPHSKMGRARA
jgi:hypothetical protein